MLGEKLSTIKEICQTKGPPTWKVRTDLDKIYEAYNNLNSGKDINYFIKSVEKDIENHQYTFFPLTLSSHPGNHWVLFIIEKLGWGLCTVCFVSSNFSYKKRAEEKEKIIPLLNKIFEELPTIRDIIPKSTQLNEHDCGVYLIKYIEHLLKENGLWGDSLQDFEITQQDIIEFRSKWKKEVGGGSWGTESQERVKKNDSSSEDEWESTSEGGEGWENNNLEELMPLIEEIKIIAQNIENKL